MKQLIFICLLAFAFQQAKTQSTQTQWTPKFENGYIYLKDGRVLKGKYLYSPQFDKIRIVHDGTSVVMDASEVEKISRKAPQNLRFSENDATEVYIPTGKNYLILGEFGVLLGNPDNRQKAPLNFHLSGDYKLGANFLAGAGVGVEFLKETYLPVTVNALYKFGDKRLTPYAILQAGYMIPIEGSRTVVRNVIPMDVNYIWPGPVSYDLDVDAKGGMLLNPSVGIFWQSGSGIGMSFSVGYRFHRLRYSNKEKDYNMDVDYNRLSVKLGIVIN